MYVRNEFTIEIYGFTHSLCIFRVCAAHGAITMENSEDRRDDGRLRKTSREIEDSKLLNKGIKTTG